MDNLYGKLTDLFVGRENKQSRRLSVKEQLDANINKPKVKEGTSSYKKVVMPTDEFAQTTPAIAEFEPYQYRPAFAKDPVPIPAEWSPVAIPFSMVARLTEMIPKVTVQAVQNYREIPAMGEAKGLTSADVGFDLKRLGFTGPVESTGKKLNDAFDYYTNKYRPEDAANPEMMILSNALRASFTTVVPDVLDVFVAQSQLKLGASLVLKATKYNPVLDNSVAELGLERKGFTLEQFKERLKITLDRQASQGDFSGVNRTLQNVDVIANNYSVVGEGMAPNFVLNKFGQWTQGLAKNLTVNDVFGRGLTSQVIAPPTGLPGYAPEPGLNFGLSIKKLQRVGGADVTGEQIVSVVNQVRQGVSKKIISSSMKLPLNAVSEIIRDYGSSPTIIQHFTKEENIKSIIEEGFNTELEPIFGVKGLEGGKAVSKFGGDDVLYFTTDSARWNNAHIYVGEGKGDVDQRFFDYEKQKFDVEKNALKKIDLKPIEAAIKGNAKTLVIDNVDDAINLIKDNSDHFDKYTFTDDIIKIARQQGYDIVNFKDKAGAWKSDILGTDKYGKNDWYGQLLGGSGKDDYFVLNKDAIGLLSEKAVPQVSAPEVREGLITEISNAEKELSGIYEGQKEVVEKALGEIWMEMEASEAGQRIMLDTDLQQKEGYEVVGVPSTFPKWIPERLRSKALFDKVKGLLTDPSKIAYPQANRSKQRELYNLLLDRVDFLAGTDTANIRENIIKNYGTIYEKGSGAIKGEDKEIELGRHTEVTESIRSGDGGTEGVGREGVEPEVKAVKESLIMPELGTEGYDGPVVEVESLGRKDYVPLLEKYKGLDIVKTGDNISVWNSEEKTLFVVALDDSKSGAFGGKRGIIEKDNNVESARKYIDNILEYKAAKEVKPVEIEGAIGKEIEPPSAPPPLLPTTLDRFGGGSVKFPKTKQFIEAAIKAMGYLDIETPFKFIKAPKTGFNVKNFFSRYKAESDKGNSLVLQLSKQNLTQDDYINATYLAAQEDISLPGVDKAKIRESADIGRNYFDKNSEILQGEEIIVDPWPESYVKRGTEQLTHLVAQKKIVTDPAKLAKIDEEIAAIKGNIKFLKSHDIKYVPIPLRVWFEDIFDSQPDSAIVLNRFFKERKTVDIKALAETLIENGVIQPQDVDIRNIIAAYSRKLGWSYAWSDIIKSGREEGLIKAELDEDEIGVWQQLPSWAAPELKGNYIHPSLFKIFDRAYNKRIKGAFNLSRPMAYAKMMAFDNPAFLLIYNIEEGAWVFLGEAMRSIVQDKSLKAFPNMVKAVGDATKMMFKKNDLYWTFMENGLQSTPYIPPFQDAMKKLEMLKETSFIKRAISYVMLNAKQITITMPGEEVSSPFAFPKEQKIPIPLDVIYKPLWDVAWNFSDRFPRLITANFLVRQGYSPAEAAKLASLHHGDYAMMSPEARTKANKVFFTPVFPMTMAKLHAAQAKALGDSLLEAGKIVAGKGSAKAQDKRIGLLVSSAIVTAGIIWGRKLLMEHWGFEEKDFGYRYVKEVKDPETGEIKQITVTNPSPDNTWLRKVHRWTSWPEGSDVMSSILNKAKWEIHPLWRVTMMNFQNRKVNGDPIFNAFGSPHEIAVDRLRFSFNEIVRIVGRFDGYNEEQKKNAQQAFRQEVGPMWYYVFKPTMNYYLGYTKEEGISYKIDALEKEFSSMMGSEKEVREREKLAPVSDEEVSAWMERLEEKMDDLLKDLPEYKEEPVEKVSIDRTLEMKEKTGLVDQFMERFGLPEEKEETLPKELQFPEEKGNRVNEFLDFDIRDIVR